MALQDSDWQHLQSASAGSTGGAITGSGITSGVDNNVWADVNNTDRVAGGTQYRKTFFKNNHATDSAVKPVIFTPTLPVNATLAIGLGENASTDDDPAQGNMTAWSANAKVALISDGADVRQVTIYGMDNAGTPVPVTEQVTLTGAVEVLSVNTYSKVHGCSVASTSGTRIVTVKQGAAGTTRGTIGISKKRCWLWYVMASTAKAAGMQLPDLAALQNIGVWRRLTWTAGVGRVSPDRLDVRAEEG